MTTKNFTVTCAAIGDPHFRPSSFKTCELFVTRCISKIQELKPTFTVVLGDVLDGHETLKTSSLNQAYSFTTTLAEICHTFVLVGNHDYINNSQFLSDKHYMKSWKLHDGITIVDSIVDRTFNGIRVLFCPFVAKGRFIEALDTCKDWKKAHCIFAHQEIAGFFYDGSTATEGDEWKEEWPILISGHIHGHQHSKNVYYTGSSMQIAVNEDDDKRLCLVKFPLKDLGDIVRIDLGLPKKRLVKLKVDDAYEYTIPEGWEEDGITIYVSGPKEDLEAFRCNQKYEELKSMKVSFRFDVEKTRTQTPHSHTGAAPNFEEILRDIIKKKRVEVRRVYKEVSTSE